VNEDAPTEAYLREVSGLPPSARSDDALPPGKLMAAPQPPTTPAEAKDGASAT